MSEKNIAKAAIQGIEYAAKAQEGFNQKQADATREISKRVNQKIDEHGKIIDIVLDELNVQEGRDLYGLLNNYDIKDMDANERQLLVNILYTLISKYEQNADQQKNYFFSVRKYLEVVSQSDEMDLSFIENIDSAQQSKAILQVVSEFLFLNKGDFSYLDEMDWLFEHFNVNDASIKKINSVIIQVYNTLGINGIINRFFPDLIEEEFFSEVEDIAYKENSEQLDSTELTNISISNILSIREGKTKKFKNHNIHISAYIICEGELIFQNCVIHYNETDASDEIRIKTNAKITFQNCIIICSGYDETPFIKCEDNSEIIFENCTFENCSEFISASSSKLFEMKRCQINNCYIDFVNISLSSKGTCEISDCIITEDKISNFNLSAARWGRLFSINSYSNNSCNIFNNTIIETSNFKNEVRNKEKNISIKHFNLYNVKIYNCTFIDAEDCIVAKQDLTVKDCRFENCKNVVSNSSTLSNFNNTVMGVSLSSIVLNGADFGSYNSTLLIDNCCFERCTEVMNLSYNSNIRYCQFLNCYNSIIRGLSGGVTIEYCEFINLKYTKKKEKADATHAFISLNKDKSHSSNSIKRCIFNGISFNKVDFIIYSYCYENPKGYITTIEECNFMNCYTENKDKEIVNKSARYTNTFKKIVDVEVTYIYQCKGLGKINTKWSTDTIEKKETNISGEKIGSTIIILQNIDTDDKEIKVTNAFGKKIGSTIRPPENIDDDEEVKEINSSKEESYSTVNIFENRVNEELIKFFHKK